LAQQSSPRPLLMDAGGCWVYPASGIPVGRRGRYTGVDLNKKATPTAASMVATFERGKDYIYNGRNYRLYDGGICANSARFA
jgi:hypothetical protein